MSNRRPCGLLAFAVVAALALPAQAPAGPVWLEDVIVSSFTNVIVSSVSDGGVPRLLLGQDGSGRVFVEQRTAAGARRSAPLGAAAPPGEARARALVAPSGEVWLAFFGDGDFVDLYALGSLDAAAPLTPQRVASVSVARDFDPDSMRLGIIAILIGLSKAPQPVPVLSFTDGDVHRVWVWNGSALLPFIEQQS